MIPIFITTRDRLTDLRLLVEWLERAGHERITLIDNASTWEPLQEYLLACPHEVHFLHENHGSQALWQAGLAPEERFVLTDPDILPTEDCPVDAVDRLAELLDCHQAQKAGLGLMLDDVPSDTPSLDWERSLVSPERELEPGVFRSLVDTTFALYERGAAFGLEALRTGAPYRARHLAWYRRLEDLDEEHRYYLAHALRGPGGTTSWEVA